MAAYGYMGIGIAGMKADSSGFERVESAAAKEAISFGKPVFSNEGTIDVVNNYKTDTKKVVMSTDLVTSNSTVVTLDGVALDAVVFATDHDTTVAAIVAAIVAAGYDAKLDAADTDNRTIYITKADTNLTVTFVTTGGAGQPTYTYTASSQQIFRGIARHVQKEPGGYEATDAVSVGVEGEYYVETSKAVSALDEAYYDPSTGKFTDSASSTLDLGLWFKRSTTAAGIAVVSLSGIKRVSTEIDY